MFTFLLLIEQSSETFTKPTYFEYVAIGSLLAGALGWLIAAVLGFARARAFGPSARWFALAAVCLIIYHIHLLLIGLFSFGADPNLPLQIGQFFNLFVVLGAICSIMGFVRLTNPR